MNHDSIIAAVSSVVDRLFEETRALGADVTVQDIEISSLNTMREIGQLLIQGQADAVGDGRVGSRIPCECGGKLRYVRTSERTVVTLCGQMTLRRAYYWCSRCGASVTPLDERLCVPDGRFSDSVVEAISYCSAQLPFECASELLEKLTGISVSAKEAQLLSEGIGAEMDEELEAQAQIAVTSGVQPDFTPDRLYVAIDGVMLREQEAWHETKLSAIYDAVPGDSTNGAGADTADLITYVARKAAPDEFGAYVSAEAQRRGESSAREVIALGDGAVWIWNLVESYFPEAVQIIDWYHVSEHVWGFARALHDGDTERCKPWVDKQLDLLSSGGVQKIMDELEAMIELTSEVGSERDSLLRYLTSNRDRMRYDEYRAKGYHIGSGVVESACKNVVQIRHKRPGMRWSADGAREVLNLRVYVLNGGWDEFWRRRSERARSGAKRQTRSLEAA